MALSGVDPQLGAMAESRSWMIRVIVDERKIRTAHWPHRLGCGYVRPHRLQQHRWMSIAGPTEKLHRNLSRKHFGEE